MFKHSSVSHILPFNFLFVVLYHLLQSFYFSNLIAETIRVVEASHSHIWFQGMEEVVGKIFRFDKSLKISTNIRRLDKSFDGSAGIPMDFIQFSCVSEILRKQLHYLENWILSKIRRKWFCCGIFTRIRWNIRSKDWISSCAQYTKCN